MVHFISHSLKHYAMPRWWSSPLLCPGYSSTSSSRLPAVIVVSVSRHQKSPDTHVFVHPLHSSYEDAHPGRRTSTCLVIVVDDKGSPMTSEVATEARSQRVEPGPTVETDAASSLSPHPPQQSFIAPPPRPPPLRHPPFLIVASLLIFMPSFPFSPFIDRACIVKSHKWHRDKHAVVTYCLPFAHPMDFSQTEHRRRRP